ncbi:hypothetical protein OH76DRAFT_335004 [Lentinus brumalis]|uniref:Uncharacterized protein n=1 Tax=Lentinus brumalis TaxID=2498619 RepID=A0A371CJT6_9APHY|nr:hypothetical protein OH76DRAFT_335004 [Polyporus brumalis]
MACRRTSTTAYIASLANTPMDDVRMGAIPEIAPSRCGSTVQTVAVIRNISPVSTSEFVNCKHHDPWVRRGRLTRRGIPPCANIGLLLRQAEANPYCYDPEDCAYEACPQISSWPISYHGTTLGQRSSVRSWKLKPMKSASPAHYGRTMASARTA